MNKLQSTRASEARARLDLAQLMSEVYALRERTRALEAELEVETTRGAEPGPYRKQKEPSHGRAGSA